MPGAGCPETMVTQLTYTEWVFSLRARARCRSALRSASPTRGSSSVATTGSGSRAPSPASGAPSRSCRNGPSGRTWARGTGLAVGALEESDERRRRREAVPALGATDCGPRTHAVERDHRPPIRLDAGRQGHGGDHGRRDRPPGSGRRFGRGRRRRRGRRRPRRPSADGRSTARRRREDPESRAHGDLRYVPIEELWERLDRMVRPRVRPERPGARRGRRTAAPAARPRSRRP